MGLTVAAALIPVVSAPGRPQDRPGRIGIKLTAAEIEGSSGLRYLIEVVLPGSPAEEAGLRPGDEVMMVAGRPVREMTPEEVVAGLKGEAGTELRLVISREEGGAVFPVTAIRMVGERLLEVVIEELLARKLTVAQYVALGEEESATDPFLAAAAFLAALKLMPDEPKARAGLEAIQSRVGDPDSTRTKEGSGGLRKSKEG